MLRVALFFLLVPFYQQHGTAADLPPVFLCDVGGPFNNTRGPDVLGHWSPFVLRCHLKVPGSGSIVVAVSCEEKGKWTRPFFISLREGQLAIVGVVPGQASDVPQKRPTLTPAPSVNLSENNNVVVKMSAFDIGTVDRVVSRQAVASFTSKLKVLIQSS